MPIKMLTCYLQMLPVIKAEETLLSYQAAALGAGPKNKRQAQQMKRQVSELVKTMNRFNGRSGKRKAGTFEDMKAMLAGMGIRVKEAPKRG